MEYQKMILIPIEKYHHLMSSSKGVHSLKVSKQSGERGAKVLSKHKIDKSGAPPKKRMKSDWIKL